jgi:acyl-CoA thioester hydrolase
MSTDSTDPLADYPVVIVFPVQWGDQDPYAHVNNTVYFRWFESARIAYCIRLGLTATAASGGIGPILAAISCNYRRPLNFPDTVRVGARVTRIGRSSFTMEHALVSEVQGQLAADGSSVLVAYDYDRKQSSPLTPELRQAIEQLEGKTF